MAGVTTSYSIIPFKQSCSISHFQSKHFNLTPHFPNSTVRTCRITCRYGGGGSYSRQGDSRRPKPTDDDPALDISSIRSSTVRLIDEEQNMVGLVLKSVAVQMAEDAELDLVILSPEADPPVVKLMDYNKYKYEQQKKKRDQQKKSSAHRVDQKELKMGYNIDVHDYSVRLRAAQKFLKDGDKVKLIVSLKGRENEFKNNAIALMRRFRDDVGELAVEERKNFRDRNMTLVLVPNKAVTQKEAPTKKEKSTETEVSASVTKLLSFNFIPQDLIDYLKPYIDIVSKTCIQILIFVLRSIILFISQNKLSSPLLETTSRELLMIVSCRVLHGFGNKILSKTRVLKLNVIIK